MTIGPAPITRMLLMSVRLGIRLFLALALVDHVDEAIEQVMAVGRAGRGLGMVLDREGRLVGAAQALVGAVEQRDVRDLGALRQRLRNDAEAVVLRGDLDLARGQVLDRLVGAAMAALHLARLAAERKRQDLMAQAEHDPEARSLLMTPDSALLQAVRRQLNPKIKSRVTLQKVRNLDDAIERSNRIAPEHLELLFPKAERYLSKVKHAGAIFLGDRSPAAIGDYVAGPSHVLPTRGSGRYSSGLSVATFMKRSSLIGFQGTKSELSQWQAALVMAETEGMENHARSLRLRLAAAR